MNTVSFAPLVSVLEGSHCITNTVYSIIHSLDTQNYNNCTTAHYLCMCVVCRDLQSDAVRWSTAGLRTVSVTRDGNTVTVVCSSTHLTSFAVLVDVGGARVSDCVCVIHT